LIAKSVTYFYLKVTFKVCITLLVKTGLSIIINKPIAKFPLGSLRGKVALPLARFSLRLFGLIYAFPAPFHYALLFQRRATWTVNFELSPSTLALGSLRSSGVQEVEEVEEVVEK